MFEFIGDTGVRTNQNNDKLEPLEHVVPQPGMLQLFVTLTRPTSMEVLEYEN